MAAIPASPTTSSRTSSRRRNPTRTVTAIHPSHLTSPTAGMLPSKVTMYVMMSLVSNIHEIDVYQFFQAPPSGYNQRPPSGQQMQGRPGLPTIFPANRIFGSES